MEGNIWCQQPLYFHVQRRTLKLLQFKSSQLEHLDGPGHLFRNLYLHFKVWNGTFTSRRLECFRHVLVVNKSTIME